MNKLLELSNDQLDLVIQNTADKLEISRTIVEKDFWVQKMLTLPWIGEF